jgi:hypothetical protein
MSALSGRQDHVEDAIATEGNSEQQQIAKIHESSGKDDDDLKPSGKDDDDGDASSKRDVAGTNDEPHDSSLAFLAWMTAMEEQEVPWKDLPDLNEAYVRLLRDVTRCDKAFPELLRKWGGYTRTKTSWLHSTRITQRHSLRSSALRESPYWYSRISLVHGRLPYSSRLKATGY